MFRLPVRNLTSHLDLVFPISYNRGNLGDIAIQCINKGYYALKVVLENFRNLCHRQPPGA